ncbi:XdhC family protein [Brevibacterium sp. BDJS002]|uniref:XdhC family protein n=1 Tax=Brevibacterium sp. BDJS002 TaxID=3020906 RepID=UPI002306FBCC|nr:XdhC family protein [Brevibacterium sp. BDJS002]WCE41207.1 XdhC family protein [Brevibacterium sp. BDJS002]
MRDIADELRTWVGSETFALAMVVRTWKSSPRPAGTMMAVNKRGEVLGSLSGGCVEGAVYELAREVMTDGKTRMAHYGVGADDAFAVGLSCGGQLDVVITCVGDQGTNAEVLGRSLDLLDEDRALTLGIPLPTSGIWPADTNEEGGLTAVGTATNFSVFTDLELHRCQSESSEFLSEVFYVREEPRPRFLVFGAIDYAQSLAEAAAFCGYEVTVCDARPVFATAARFPATNVVVEWPHRYLARQIAEGRVHRSTVIAVLTHDMKFDVPLLKVALRSPAEYVGALGSRRTHTVRVESLKEAGVPGELIRRLHAPIGLDLGAETPQETAISIMSEVIQLKRQGTGDPLSAIDGAIHRPVGVEYAAV